MTIIAVADPMCIARMPKPNEMGAYIEIHDDGRVFQDGKPRRDAHLTPEEVRRLIASLVFPGDQMEAFEWDFARIRANRRAALAKIAQEG